MIRAGGQYPRTGVLVGTAITARARRPHQGGRNLRLVVKQRRSVEKRLETTSITATRFATEIRTWLLIAARPVRLNAIGGARRMFMTRLALAERIQRRVIRIMSIAEAASPRLVGRWGEYEQLDRVCGTLDIASPRGPAGTLSVANRFL